MVFTNKHVIIAMIVAPILAVLAWFGVGQLAADKPQPAKPGTSYPLVEKSNCRYESGSCDLQNEDFKLILVYREGAAGPQMVLTSSHPLEGVVLAAGPVDQTGQPAPMRATDGQGLEWALVLAARPAAEDRIRLVARAGGSSYFADASTAFLQPDDR